MYNSIAEENLIKYDDPALIELNYNKYGLEKRTGVDFQRFSKNRRSGKPLSLSDKRVFMRVKNDLSYQARILIVQ